MGRRRRSAWRSPISSPGLRHDRNSGGHCAAAGHWQGAAYRHGALRHDERRSRQSGDELPGVRHISASSRQCTSEYRALSDFRVSDGHIIVACGNDRQFAAICDILGLDGVASDERYATNRARVEHRTEVAAMIEAKTRTMTRDVLLALLEEKSVPPDRSTRSRMSLPIPSSSIAKCGSIRKASPAFAHRWPFLKRSSRHPGARRSTVSTMNLFEVQLSAVKA